MNLRHAALIAAMMALTSGAALAQTYPDRPIRLVVPFPAGGGGDAIARPLAQRLSEQLGQQVVIENKGGANGNIGAEDVARAAPDGYSLLFANSSLMISVNLYKKLPFDVLTDFAPVGLASVSASVLVVHPSVKAKTPEELVALAKSKPGKLNFGSAGRGSTMHLAGELFKSMTGADIVHVPYKGAGPAISDLIGGHVEVVFVNIPPVLSNIQAGKVRALAVTTKTRSAVLPDVPTLDESGLPGYQSTTWYGILAPAGTPQPIVERLNRELAKAVNTPDLQAQLRALGSEPSPDTPAEFGTFIRSDIASWAKVMQASGVTPD